MQWPQPPNLPNLPNPPNPTTPPCQTNNSASASSGSRRYSSGSGAGNGGMRRRLSGGVGNTVVGGVEKVRRNVSKRGSKSNRSVDDRKKHAGWKTCPACHMTVSTNGRNFFYHMQKCNDDFFKEDLEKYRRDQQIRKSQKLAKAAAKKAKMEVLRRGGLIQSEGGKGEVRGGGRGKRGGVRFGGLGLGEQGRDGVAVGDGVGIGGEYAGGIVNGGKGLVKEERGFQEQMGQRLESQYGGSIERMQTAIAQALEKAELTTDQRIMFIEQLCFLRTYNRDVDDALRKLETDSGKWGVWTADSLDVGATNGAGNGMDDNTIMAEIPGLRSYGQGVANDAERLQTFANTVTQYDNTHKGPPPPSSSFILPPLKQDHHQMYGGGQQGRFSLGQSQSPQYLQQDQGHTSLPPLTQSQLGGSATDGAAASSLSGGGGGGNEFGRRNTASMYEFGAPHQQPQSQHSTPAWSPIHHDTLSPQQQVLQQPQGGGYSFGQEASGYGEGMPYTQTALPYGSSVIPSALPGEVVGGRQ